MKVTRLVLVLLLTLTALLLVNGCSKHYVDVYINEICMPVTLENDPETAIDPLWVFPGDYVIFNNMREEDLVEMVFPTGLFEVERVEIEAGHRVILKVVAEGPMEGPISISGDGCGAGIPKVKVGEDP
jgi:hypothetical protein